MQKTLFPFLLSILLVLSSIPAGAASNITAAARSVTADINGNLTWPPVLTVGTVSPRHIFVSANGNDTIGAKGTLQAFATYAAARAVAISGDTIIVYPGTYPENIDVKDGVNIHMLKGAKFTGTIGLVNYPAGGSCDVTGEGEIAASNSGLWLTNYSGAITLDKLAGTVQPCYLQYSTNYLTVRTPIAGIIVAKNTSLISIIAPRLNSVSLINHSAGYVYGDIVSVNIGAYAADHSTVRGWGNILAFSDGLDARTNSTITWFGNSRSLTDAGVFCDTGSLIELHGDAECYTETGLFQLKGSGAGVLCGAESTVGKPVVRVWGNVRGVMPIVNENGLVEVYGNVSTLVTLSIGGDPIDIVYKPYTAESAYNSATFDQPDISGWAWTAVSLIGSGTNRIWGDIYSCSNAAIRVQGTGRVEHYNGEIRSDHNWCPILQNAGNIHLSNSRISAPDEVVSILTWSNNMAPITLSGTVILDKPVSAGITMDGIYTLGGTNYHTPVLVVTNLTVINTINGNAATAYGTYSDLNDALPERFVMGVSSAANVPQGDWFTGFTVGMNGNVDYEYQFGYELTGVPFTRGKIAGTWGSWQKVLKEDGAIYGVSITGNAATATTAANWLNAGTIASRGSNEFALAAGSIRLKHIDGTEVFYNPTADTDVARGTALLLAVTNAVSGDILYLSANTYDLEVGVIDLSLGATGTISLHGAGKYQTVLKSSGAEIIKPGSNSETTDLAIYGTGDPHSYHMPWGPGTAGHVYTNALLKNVYIRNWSDGLMNANTNGDSAVIINVTIDAGYDAVSWTFGTLTIYDSVINADASLVPTWGIARAIIASYGAVINLYNTSITAQNGASYNWAVWPHNTAQVNIFGGKIFSSGTDALDIENVSGTVSVTANTIYNPAKVSGIITHADSATLVSAIGVLAVSHGGTGGTNGISTTWTNLLAGVATNRIVVVGGIVVTNELISW